MSAGWSDPNNVIFSPWNANFTRGTRQKMWSLSHGMWFLPGDPPWNAIGLVLSSNWAGFVVKTWQPWRSCTVVSASSTISSMQNQPARWGIVLCKWRSALILGMFAPLPDLHNSFSELGANTTQTACTNKWHYYWAQFILSELSPIIPPCIFVMEVCELLLRLVSRCV